MSYIKRPWEVGADSWADNHVDINAPGHGAIAVVVVALDGREFPEGQANARLMASAPQLLEALELAKSGLEAHVEYS